MNNEKENEQNYKENRNMKIEYAYTYTEVSDVVDALVSLAPSFVTVARLPHSISREAAFAFADTILAGIYDLAPRQYHDKIRGQFMAYGGNGSDSTDFGNEFGFAICGTDSLTFPSTSNFGWFRKVIADASRNCALDHLVSEAVWWMEDGKELVDAMAMAVHSAEGEYAVYSDQFLYRLSLFPFDSRGLDRGDAGDIARFIGIARVLTKKNPPVPHDLSTEEHKPDILEEIRRHRKLQ